MPFSSGSGFLPLPPVGVIGGHGSGRGYGVSPGRPALIEGVQAVLGMLRLARSVMSGEETGRCQYERFEADRGPQAYRL